MASDLWGFESIRPPPRVPSALETIAPMAEQAGQLFLKKKQMDQELAMRQMAMQMQQAQHAETARHHGALENAAQGGLAERQAALAFQQKKEEEEGIKKPFYALESGMGPDRAAAMPELSVATQMIENLPKQSAVKPSWPTYGAPEQGTEPLPPSFGPSPREKQMNEIHNLMGQAGQQISAQQEKIAGMRAGPMQARIEQPAPKDVDAISNFRRAQHLAGKIREQLNDPEIASQVGPAMGNWAKAKRWVAGTTGNPKLDTFMDNLEQLVVSSTAAQTGMQHTGPKMLQLFSTFHPKNTREATSLAASLDNFSANSEDALNEMLDSMGAAGKNVGGLRGLPPAYAPKAAGGPGNLGTAPLPPANTVSNQMPATNVTTPDEVAKAKALLEAKRKKKGK